MRVLLPDRIECSNIYTFIGRHDGKRHGRHHSSSREFNQDTNRAKKATRDGPVFITDRGKPAHCPAQHRGVSASRRTRAALLPMSSGMPPGVEDVEFDPPRTVIVSRPADPVLMILLDTNVVSELRKLRAGEADANVARWAGSVDIADLYLSVITVMELEAGVLQMERHGYRPGRDPARLAGYLCPAGLRRPRAACRHARRQALRPSPCSRSARRTGCPDRGDGPRPRHDRGDPQHA